MTPAEAAYFDGNHCQHVADREEHERQQRIQRAWHRATERARLYAKREWDVLEGRPMQQRVKDDMAARRADPEWRARVNAEWDAA